MLNESNEVFSDFGRHQQFEEIIKIRKHLSEIGQDYIEHRDIDDLKNHIAQNFGRCSL